MAVIAPFRAVRYNLEKISRMGDVVTPPYDVIDARAQAAFVAKNPYNMIQLDLSKKMEQTPVSEGRYEGARQRFEAWQQEGVLQRDETAGFYVYHVEYPHPSGRRLLRKGFVSMVQLAEFSEGIVKPHEKTFSGVTSDRLRLMDACQAHFSQIFSLYSDPEAKVMRAIESAQPEEPLCSVVDQDGCRHTLFAVTDAVVLNQVQQLFRDKALYIADGHHRYTTCLQLRELKKKEMGGMPADHPYNFTMMYLCPMEDEGLSVLPTHRLIRVPDDDGRSVSATDLTTRFAECFSVEEISGASREMLVSETLARIEEQLRTASLGDKRATVFGLYHPGEDRSFVLSLKQGCMDQRVGDLPAALRDLDVVVLSELIVERLLALPHERCEKEELIDFFSDPDDALDLAVKESSLAGDHTPVLFLMNATTVGQVKRIADEGLIMPHKSTYFYPKIMTGMLMNRIVVDEQVILPLSADG